MPSFNGRLVGCNVIDPLLEVTTGSDYSVEITHRSLAFLREIGYDAIEFSHACHWSVQECQSVRKITEQLDLFPWSLHVWVADDVMTPEGARNTAEMLRIAIRNAQILGTPIIVHHPNGQGLGSDADRERLRREAELLAMLVEPGIRLALENGSTLDSMEYLLALVDLLGPHHAGVCVDTGHAALGDLGPGRAIRMAGERLITTHLQDNCGQYDDHLPPGDGHIDWQEVVAALIEIDYGGCLMLELTDQPSNSGRRLTIRDELQRAQRAVLALAEKMPPLNS
ncbi:MAG: sugar phosphate isomerase/epimerase family protein [Candidatus Zipacnadales bacterium]